MSVITEKHLEIINKSEWIAIATEGEEGAHVVGTWCDYLEFIEEDTILIPVGGYVKTSKNLAVNNKIELLCGTRQVMGANSAGKGCFLKGTAEVQNEGRFADIMKEKFVWSRGALVVHVEKASTQL
ncbi:MAG: pyridoxamine 5'-phosphate oxidase family protein [Deferribacterales bacterium]